MRACFSFVLGLVLAGCSNGAAVVDTPQPKTPVQPLPTTTATAAATATAAPDPLEAKVRSMAQIKRARSASLSPDGKRIAFVSDLGALPELYVVPLEGGAPERITSLQDPVGSVTWSPDGAWLAVSVAPGGGMNQQVYLVRPDG